MKYPSRVVDRGRARERVVISHRHGPSCAGHDWAGGGRLLAGETAIVYCGIGVGAAVDEVAVDGRESRVGEGRREGREREREREYEAGCVRKLHWRGIALMWFPKDRRRTQRECDLGFGRRGKRNRVNGTPGCWVGSTRSHLTGCENAPLNFQTTRFLIVLMDLVVCLPGANTLLYCSQKNTYCVFGLGPAPIGMRPLFNRTILWGLCRKELYLHL